MSNVFLIPDCGCRLSLAMKFTFRLSLIILIHLVATSHASHHFTNVDYDNGLLCHTNDSVPIPWDFTTQSQTTIYSIALSSDKVKVGQTVTGNVL